MHDRSVRFATRGNALGVDEGRKMDWKIFIFWGVEAGVVDLENYEINGGGVLGRSFETHRREAVVGTGMV